MKRIFWLVTLLVVFLSACNPLGNNSNSGEQPASAVENQPAVSDQGYQPVGVDGVEVVVGVGSPIPIHVNISGNLPDTCAQVELVQQKQEGSTFFFTVSTVPSRAEGCIQDALPFRISLPLNAVNLPAGTYTVDVNGTPASFELNIGNTNNELPVAGTSITKDDITVDSVDVEVGVGSPIPVHAVVSGNLPGTCAQVGEIRLHREETTFYVRLIAYSPVVSGCVPDSLPFRLEVPLNIVNLPEGPYEVNVNGATTSFDPRSTPDPSAGLDEFTNNLSATLAQRDEQALQAFMGEAFPIALWRSEAVSYPPQEAVRQLLDNYLSPGTSLAFQDFQAGAGVDPQALAGPDVELAKSVLVSGWGSDGQGEALLLIARREDGSFYWHSVLVAPQGFAPAQSTSACTDPVDIPVVNGTVTYNGVSFNIDPALADSVMATTCPEVPLSQDQAPGEAHPPYTGFSFPKFSRSNVDYQPEVRIYEITGDLSQYTFPLNMLADLKTLLDIQSESIRWFDAAPLHAQQKYLGFNGGSGVRGLVQYMQDYFFYTNNGLLYEFHGLTQDGKHFVSVRYPVSVPFLMELADPFTLPPNNINPEAIPVPDWSDEYDEQLKIIEAYNTEASSRLRLMEAGEATPDLTLLDALVSSIQVEEPAGSTE